MLLSIFYLINSLIETAMVVLVLIKPLMTLITVFNVIITGDSMLNNINSRGLSKSNKVSVSNFPGAPVKIF